MKIIFSRKGFDSATGRCPSPIVEGRCISLPIPTKMPTTTVFGDLPDGMGEMVAQLSRGRMPPDRPCHLDPDIDTNLRPRPDGWRGALGQAGAAQSHLANQRVGPGDLFLFWGLYRPAEKHGEWRYVGDRHHRLFGWLQISEVLRVGADPGPALRRFPWLSEHPHLQPGWGPDNVVYVATESLVINGQDWCIRGWGVLREGVRLTCEGASPSRWRPPRWLHPGSGGPGMTYHPPQRWLADGTLRAAGRGQEFVADIGRKRRPITWLRELLQPLSH